VRSLIAAGLVALAFSSAALAAEDKTPAQLKAEAQAKLDAFPHKASPEASVYRGTLVFLNYCVTCHGANADGQGRAARLYTPKPANLRTSMVPDLYKDMIIRRGGKAMGRSEFMPPWGQELTDEQIGDVVTYLRSIAPANAPK
jgi:mono/diheme cytochrome c family protein